jgi:hypothetical protein
MISDALRWLERDLREVVYNYFQPLRLIGRDISDALPKHDHVIDVFPYIETLAEDDKNTSRWYLYRRRAVEVALSLVVVSVIASAIVLMALIVGGLIYPIILVVLKYTALVGSVVAMAMFLLLGLAQGLEVWGKWRNIGKHRRPDNQQADRDL